MQQEWAELSLEVNQLDSQMRALQDRRARSIENRLVAANDFQENFQLVDPPRVPQLPAKPERNQFMIMGIALVSLACIVLFGVYLALHSRSEIEEIDEEMRHASEAPN